VAAVQSECLGPCHIVKRHHARHLVLGLVLHWPQHDGFRAQIVQPLCETRTAGSDAEKQGWFDPTLSLDGLPEMAAFTSYL
jgi:hypothetical protein